MDFYFSQVVIFAGVARFANPNSHVAAHAGHWVQPYWAQNVDVFPSHLAPGGANSNMELLAVPAHPSAGPLGGWWVIFVASTRGFLHTGPSQQVCLT